MTCRLADVWFCGISFCKWASIKDPDHKQWTKMELHSLLSTESGERVLYKGRLFVVHKGKYVKLMISFNPYDSSNAMVNTTLILKPTPCGSEHCLSKVVKADLYHCKQYRYVAVAFVEDDV